RGPAVRRLHPGHRDGGEGAARAHARAHRARGALRPRRQPLPLHGLRQDRARGARCCRRAARARSGRSGRSLASAPPKGGVMFRPALVTMALLLAAPAWAKEDGPPTPRDQVSFRVEVTREVPNDWLSATLGVDEESTDAAALAARVNQRMAPALT